MSKLRRDVKICDGRRLLQTISVGVFLLGARVLLYYDDLRVREPDAYASRHPQRGSMVDSSCSWNVVLSVVESLIVHRYLAAGRPLTFLLASDAVVLVGWELTIHR